MEIFWADLNSAGSVSKKSCKLVSLSKFAFIVSGIALLYKLRGMTDYCADACSSIICVGDGGGAVDTRSTTFSGVIVVLAFFGRPACAPASTNR